METELKNMLTQILANQVIIYKRLEEIEYKVKGGGRLASIRSYVEELFNKSKEINEEIIKYLPR